MIPFEEIRKTEDRSWTFRLIDEIRNSSPDDDLKEVCDTLGCMDDPRTIEPMIQILENRNLPIHVREAASEVLQHGCIARCEADRRAWWTSGDKLLMKHALLEARTSEADIIIPIASDPAHEFHRDAIAGIEFGFEEPEYKRLLIKALEHPSAEIRGIAARNLTWDEPIEAEDGLIRLLGDPDDNVAEDALDTLRYFSSQKAFRSLATHQHSVRESLKEELLSAVEGQRDCFEAMYERLPKECRPFVLTWVKPIEDLLPLRKETEKSDAADEETAPKHPPRTPREKTILSTANEFMSFFEDPDACWNGKHSWKIKCDWVEFSSQDREILTVYFRDHSDHHMREYGCCALRAWDRGDILEMFLHDACSGVKRSAAYHLKRVTVNHAIAATLMNAYLDVNSTGELVSNLLQAYVVHAPEEGVEGLLADIARSERRLSRKQAAVSELIRLGAHSQMRSLLCLLGEAPLLNWGLHRDLVEYCVEQKVSVPHFSELCKADDLYLQESLAKALPYLKPILLKGVSYAAKN